MICLSTIHCATTVQANTTQCNLFHAVSVLSSTIIGYPFNNDLSSGLELDLVCDVEISTAVDSTLDLNRTWTLNGTELTSDSVHPTVSGIEQIMLDGRKFLRTMVSYDTLMVSDSGLYQCTVNIGSSSQYITGTSATVSRDLPISSKCTCQRSVLILIPVNVAISVISLYSLPTLSCL